MISGETRGAGLAARKRELLARLLLKKTRERRTFPLSFVQERLWFLHQLVPNGNLYNLPKSVRLTGPLNATALEQTLSEITRRHEILRTTYRVVEGKPVQVVAPADPITLPVADLRGLSLDERESWAKQLCKDESLRPFDLGKGPVLRVRLLRLEEQEHLVLFTLHHIAGDGLSLGVLVYELAMLYKAFFQGAISPFAELPIQYADFAVWQRRLLEGEVLEQHLAYWKRALGGSIPRIKLPVDHPITAAESHHGASVFFHVPADVAQSLDALGREESATLFMTTLAAFMSLLHRYSGQDDIIVGSPISNRHRVETENLIGCLINTLALRVDLSGNPTFRQLIGRVKEVTLGAYAHQDLPFEKLVQELQPERRLSPTPLFHVWFALDHVPTYVPIMSLAGLQFSEFWVDAVAAQFDLTLTVTRLGQEIIGFLNYKTELMERETVDEIIGHFKNLLVQVGIDPDRPILDIPLVEGEQGEPCSTLASPETETDDDDQFLF